jgi:hypothetical protein
MRYAKKRYAKSCEPDWVKKLYDQVCEDEGRSKTRRPKLFWTYSKVNTGTSGRFFARQNWIRIVAGTRGDDHKQVFLHEIAHWLTKPRGWKKKWRYNGHSKRFWKKLDELLIRYDCKTKEYCTREYGYMKRSELYL